MKDGKDYQAECDANDVMRAMEVIGDKARLMKAKEYLGKKKEAIKTLDDLFALKERGVSDGEKEKSQSKTEEVDDMGEEG